MDTPARLTGTRDQVWKGYAIKTSTGLRKKDLMINPKTNKVISKKMYLGYQFRKQKNDEKKKLKQYEKQVTEKDNEINSKIVACVKKCLSNHNQTFGSQDDIKIDKMVPMESISEKKVTKKPRKKKENKKEEKTMEELDIEIKEIDRKMNILDDKLLVSHSEKDAKKIVKELNKLRAEKKPLRKEFVRLKKLKKQK